VYRFLSSKVTNPQLKLSKPASFHYEVMEAHVLKHECFQGVEFEDEQISVADGLLTVKPGFQWRSFSMGFHAPLVFLGWRAWVLSTKCLSMVSHGPSNTVCSEPCFCSTRVPLALTGRVSMQFMHRACWMQKCRCVVYGVHWHVGSVREGPKLKHATQRSWRSQYWCSRPGQVMHSILHSEMPKIQSLQTNTSNPWYRNFLRQQRQFLRTSPFLHWQPNIVSQSLET